MGFYILNIKIKLPPRFKKVFFRSSLIKKADDPRIFLFKSFRKERGPHTQTTHTQPYTRHTYTHTYSNTQTYTHKHTHTQTNQHTQLLTFIHTHKHTYTCHTHTHITHTYI